MNITPTFGAVTLHKSRVEETAGFKKSTEAYNEFAKLVFLFDVSGSMNTRIVTDAKGKSYLDEYIWTDEIIADIRQRVDNIRVHVEQFTAGETDIPLTSQEEKLYQSLCDPFTNLTKYQNDVELKTLIVKADLIDTLGILKNTIAKPKFQEPPTRIGIVKKLAKQEIHRRFQKFPKSLVTVMPFSGVSAVLFEDGAEGDIDTAINKLSIEMSVDDRNGGETHMDGGTDIMQAIAHAIEVCRKKPSPVGIHHFLIVTDGEDWSTHKISEWVPSMKESGIVLDYIHIGDSSPNAELQRACKELGGEYQSVNTERDLEEKFVQAVHRQMLPPASVK